MRGRDSKRILPLHFSLKTASYQTACDRDGHALIAGARMPHPAGRYLPLSLPRRLICDLVHFAHQVPTVPVERRMSLAPVVAARKQAVPRPSWCALFTKAFAFVAAARPELRRAYMAFPFAHLYEHPLNIASVAVERRLGDEEAVFFAHLKHPERMGLVELDAELRRCKA